MSRLVKMISIPDYWHDYVNSKVDLRTDPKQPCPFHNEQHGQSFSYRADKNYFSCFGACHVLGGDVVRLHMLNYKIRDYDEAEKSLARLYGITLEKEISFTKPEIQVNERDIAFRVAYAKACVLARTPDDWIELDFIMSQYPPSVDQLTMFINSRRLSEGRSGSDE